MSPAAALVPGQELYAAARQVVRAWRGPASGLADAVARLGRAVGLEP
jgi:hypothetical protein